MYFFINYAWAFNMTYLPTYIEERFSMSAGDKFGALYKGAPLWIGAAGCFLGGFCVNGLARLLGDRRRARRVLGIVALSTGAACWWGASHTENVHLFCLLISLAAFCIDLTLGSSWATCQDLGREHAAVTAACMNTIGTLGNALAGWLTGTLVEQSLATRAAAQELTLSQLSTIDRHLAVLSGYESAFATYVTVFILAALCWTLIDPTKPIASGERPMEPGRIA